PTWFAPRSTTSSSESSTTAISTDSPLDNQPRPWFHEHSPRPGDHPCNGTSGRGDWLGLGEHYGAAGVLDFAGSVRAPWARHVAIPTAPEPAVGDRSPWSSRTSYWGGLCSAPRLARRLPRGAAGTRSVRRCRGRGPSDKR